MIKPVWDEFEFLTTTGVFPGNPIIKINFIYIYTYFFK